MSYKLEDLIHHSVDEVHEILWSQEPYSVFEDYQEFKILLLRRIEIFNESLSFISEAFVL